MAVFTFLALMEFMDLSSGGGLKTGGLTSVVYAGLIVYLGMFGQINDLRYEFIVAFLIQWVSAWFLYKRLSTGQHPTLLFSTMFIWLPLAALALWASQHQDVAYKPLLFFFVTIWLYDSMAYLVGKAIGKRPIFPKTSPKKTVEGTIGGILSTVIVMSLADFYYFGFGTRAYVFVTAIVLFGIFGDLFESYFKRKLGVKDSGKLIPGHGGILDRIDSILLAALPYVVLLTLYELKM
jgi:CDP-diglyceride synthetase